jgi:hypothetical protein
VAITVDREGKPLDLAVMGAGELNGSIDLPIAFQPVAGHLTAGRGRIWELEGHLDLTQPGRPSLRALLTQPARLMQTVMADGSVQMRSYGTSNANLELSGHAAAGFKLGAGFSHTMSSRRLLTAMDHTREGFWVPRYDCMDSS